MAELSGQLTMFGEGAALGEDLKQKAFEDKFKLAKTTDDCYTPEVVYDAVADWVAAEYGLNRADFVRPFWPGGDYERHEYPEGCAVVDNPPFSLLAKIIAHYQRRGVRFFLFAPTLTLFTRREDVCHMPIGVGVTYENGAVVNTSFITNMEPAGRLLRTVPELYRAVAEADAKGRAERRAEVPKYNWPDEILTAAMAYRYSQYGVAFELYRGDCVRVSTLDAMREAGKGGIFGGAYLLNSRRAAERQAAERQAAERQAAERRKRNTWKLSERERAIIARMDERRR